MLASGGARYMSMTLHLTDWLRKIKPTGAPSRRNSTSPVFRAGDDLVEERRTFDFLPDTETS
jgi:hypothetical protein